jgi:transposase
MIQANDRQLYRGYCLKEALRMIFKNTDADKAESEPDHWLWWAIHSRIPVFHDLFKLIIRKAYGFRNIQNMLDMVYLVCSNIRIPLPNRKSRNR